MTIVVIAGRYYVPFMDGYKELNHDQALYLYEQGYFDSEDVENIEWD